MIRLFCALSRNGGSGVQRTPSNRSTASTVSSLISLEPIIDEQQDASLTDVTDTATIQTQGGTEDENRYLSTCLIET